MKDYNNSEILIYQSENGMTKIDVKIIDETVWLIQAIAKANEEYQKYQTQNLSPVEKEYLLTIKYIEKQVKNLF